MTSSLRSVKKDEGSFTTSSTVPGATTFGDEKCNKQSMEGRYSETHRPVEMNRKDSGFAETRKEIQWQVQDKQPHQGILEEEAAVSPSLTPVSKQSNPTDIESQGLTRHRPNRPPTCMVSSRSRSHDHRSSISTSSHRTSSRRSSTSRPSVNIHQTSRPFLLHAASSFRRQPTIHNRVRPAISLRTTSAPIARGHANDPFAIHYNSCRLFQSPGAIIAYQQFPSPADSTENLTRSSMPSLRQGSETAYESIPPISSLLHITTVDEKGLPYESISNGHIPATVIDWTSPSTRRREHEKIDKSSRGFRGWWRRVAPRWCSSASRTGFYAGDDDSDAGSVRRYRVDLPDDEDDNKEMPVKVKETQKRPSLAIVQRSWSCFSFHNKQAVKHGV